VTRSDRRMAADAPSVSTPTDAGGRSVTPNAHLHQGWALYAAGDARGASEVARSAAETAPGDPEAAYLLGMALKAAGDSRKAAVAFRTSASLAAEAGTSSRHAMLRRLAVGHANWLETGNWDLEPETWVRT